MSVMLYALRLHPFLRMLEQRKRGIKIGRPARRTSVVAYTADNDIRDLNRRLPNHRRRYSPVRKGIWGTSQPT